MDVSDFARALGAAADELLGDLADGLDEAAHDVLEEAQRLVPVETGDLRNSGVVRVDRENLTAQVAFTSDHAAVVHELLDAHHDQGQAHYLIDPLIAAKKTMPATVAAKVRR